MVQSIKINQVVLTNQPSHWAVIPPQDTVEATAGAGKIVTSPLVPPDIELRWGQEGTDPAVIAELKAKRGMRIGHVVSWASEDGLRQYHANVAIPQIGYGQGPSMNAIDPLTLLCPCYIPVPGARMITLDVPTNPLTTGDSKARWKAPAGGRILKVGGSITTLGTGTGQTRVQIHNATGPVDMLSTRGDFIVASATRLLENQVLIASPTFNKNDVLHLDIDSVPSGADSAYAHIWMLVLLYGVKG